MISLGIVRLENPIFVLIIKGLDFYCEFLIKNNNFIARKSDFCCLNKVFLIIDYIIKYKMALLKFLT